MIRIVFIFLITSTSLFSQSVIGFKIAGNQTSFNFIERWKTTKGGVQGINAGLIYKFYNEPHLAIQLELNYSQRGGVERFDDSSIIRKYNYIEVPFMTHIHGGNKLKFFINFGPTIGYNLSGTDYTTIAGVEEKTKHKFSDKENRFDAGLVLGAGLVFDSSIGEIQLEPRFQYSLTNVNKGEDVSIRSNYIIISLSAAYLIKWEKVFK